MFAADGTSTSGMLRTYFLNAAHWASYTFVRTYRRMPYEFCLIKEMLPKWGTMHGRTVGSEVQMEVDGVRVEKASKYFHA